MPRICGMQVTLVDPAVESRAASASIAAASRRRRCCTSPTSSNEARHATAWGVTFGEPKIDLDKLRAFKDEGRQPADRRRSVSSSKQRKITYLQGTAAFRDARTLDIERVDGRRKPRR